MPASTSTAGSSSTTRCVTSHPRVLAVGECAQHRGIVHGIVAPIHEQAKVAAATLCGEQPPTGLDPDGEAQGDGRRPRLRRAPGRRPRGRRRRRRARYRKLIVDAEGRTVGTILLGDTRGAELLHRRRPHRPRGAPTRSRCWPRPARPPPPTSPTRARVCNCHGVCKGEIVDAIRTRGLGSTLEVVSVTRAGAGCGSCKPLVGELLAIERGGAAEEADLPLPVPAPDARGAGRGRARARPGHRVSELSAACGAGRDCGACKPGLAYLVSEICGNRHREERHARFINDRVHANIQNDGTFSRRPADPRRRHDAGRAAPDRRRRRPPRGAADQDHRRPADRPARHPQGAAAGDLGGARHALRPRLRQGGADGQDVRRHRLLPLRPRRRDGRRDRARARDGGPLHAAQGQVRGHRLPAQLRRGLRQGHRARRGRGRLGALRRRRRGRDRAQGRPAGDRRRPPTRRSGSRSPSCSTTASPRSTSSAPTPTSSASGIEPVRDGRARRTWTSCSSATGSPRPPPTPTRGASATTPSTRSSSRSSTPSPLVGPPRRLVTASPTTWTLVGRVEDIPLLEGRSTSVDGRRIAIFRLLGRPGRDRRPLPARRRPAGRRDRRRLVRHLPAARAPLRPHDRAGAQRARDRRRPRGPRATTGEIWVRLA